MQHGMFKGKGNWQYNTTKAKREVRVGMTLRSAESLNFRACAQFYDPQNCKICAKESIIIVIDEITITLVTCCKPSFEAFTGLQEYMWSHSSGSQCLMMMGSPWE